MFKIINLVIVLYLISAKAFSFSSEYQEAFPYCIGIIHEQGSCEFFTDQSIFNNQPSTFNVTATGPNALKILAAYETEFASLNEEQFSYQGWNCIGEKSTWSDISSLFSSNKVSQDFICTKDISKLGNYYSLDNHIHYWSDPDIEFSEIDRFKAQNNIQKSLVLASAFISYSPLQFAASQEEFLKSSPQSQFETRPEHRKTNFDSVSEYTQINNNSRGLCGVQISWEDLNEIADYCLSLPGMIGLKIHHSVEEDNNGHVNASKLNSLLSRYKDRKLVILWDVHYSVESQLEDNGRHLLGELNDETRELRLLENTKASFINNSSASRVLNVVNQNPQHTFIIAHVFSDFFGARAFLNALYPLPVPENVMFDCAASIPAEQINDPILRNYALNIWRKLGVNKILFGTDYGYFGPARAKQFMDRFKTESDLNQEELFQIYLTNGIKFWNKYK